MICTVSMVWGTKNPPFIQEPQSSLYKGFEYVFKLPQTDKPTFILRTEDTDGHG